MKKKGNRMIIIVRVHILRERLGSVLSSNQNKDWKSKIENAINLQKKLKIVDIVLILFWCKIVVCFLGHTNQNKRSLSNCYPQKKTNYLAAIVHKWEVCKETCSCNRIDQFCVKKSELHHLLLYCTGGTFGFVIYKT